MISGEYLVLHGATAFAIPVRFGQSMRIAEDNEENILSWITFVKDQPWFKAQFSSDKFELINHNNAGSAIYVQQVLHAARLLNPGFLTNNSSFRVECRIDFDTQWGLGSSSSLISNVAYWCGIDPLELHAAVSKGSGYDVACARSSKPILFTNAGGEKKSVPIDFNPPFSDNIYFIYLGKKQDSQADVDIFMRGKTDYENEITRISNISKQMVTCTTYDAFGNLMREHEEIMSGVLGRPTLKSSVFSDFPGEIKSLGAWGGDFAMALWPKTKNELGSYLSGKNLDTFFNLNEMIYDRGDEQNQQ
jgi:mevalonate kinase